MSSYESIYPGADYLLPKNNPTGYVENAGSLGMSLDPRSANQLGDVNKKINPGLKHIEISGITPNVFESIPDEHLTEIKRLGKLAGFTNSLHAPILEFSGVGERGWDETNRIGAERQLESAVLRAHLLDPNGNVSVVTHSAAQLPEMEPKIKVMNPKTGKLEEKQTGLWVVNPDSGKFTMIQPERRYFPEEGDGKFTPEEARKFSPEAELSKINNDAWTDQLSGINREAEYGEGMIDRAKKMYQIPDEVFSEIAKGQYIDKIDDPELKKMFEGAQKEITHGQIYLRGAYRHMKDLFDKAWVSVDKNDDKDGKEKLRSFANRFAPDISKGIELDPTKIEKLNEVVNEGLKVLKDIENPKTWVPLQEFAIDKSSETFANVAASAYKKFGDTAPILNIENPPAGMTGLSRAEDLKKIVEESRDKLVQSLVKEGKGEDEAKRVAEKLIGATWDVGHINMIRKKGYSEQDVIKETEIIAPFVKHVHLSDNFGLDHTELPMGMGNVPIKEIMKKLGEKGFEGKKIIEAGNWWQFFAEQGGGNPFKPSIQNFDSPIYAMKGGYGWSQLGGYSAYYMGQGPISPAIHHNVYGAGFAALPVELGGEIPGTRDRLSGTPMQ